MDNENNLPPNNKPVWAWYATKYVKHLIPCIAQYTEGWDIEVGDEDGDRDDLNYSEEKDTTFLPKGWYECCEQSGGTYDEIYIKRDVVKWQSVIEPATPAPLSEQKQEGENVEEILTTEFYKKMRSAFDMYKSVRHRLHYMKEVTGFDSQNIMKHLIGLGVDGTLATRIHKLMFHAEWLEQSKVFEWLEKRRVDLVCDQSRQSQNPAKQIDQYKARIVELEEKLSGIETKHQEELANYNSYAASHVEEQFENKIEELAEWLERDKQVAIGMMGELANPAVVVYDTCISRLKAINID